MTNIAKYWKEDTNLLHWNRGVFYNNRAITDITQLGNSGIVYSKKIWEEIGGHPLENAGYDMTFVQAIRKKGGIVEAAPPDEEVSWFYMWGGRGYHMSGQGTDVPGKANVIKRHASHVERERQQGRIPTGNVQLYPRWKVNYKHHLKEFVSKKKG
jgi:hypothetical protein